MKPYGAWGRYRSAACGTSEPTSSLTATMEPEPPRIPNVQHALAREDATTGRRGEEIAFYVAWVYGHVVSALACSGRRDSWQWTDAAYLVTLQTERISQFIGRFGS